MSNLLSTSSHALLAFQHAIASVGHNVANVKTAGYSRQQVEFANRSSGGVIGNGAQISDIRRVADQLATARLWDSHGELKRLEQVATLSARIDERFSDKATGLAAPWSDFFNAVSAVSARPSDIAARRNLLDNAQGLAQRFEQLNAHLDTLTAETQQTIRTTVEEINQLATEVAQLNADISHSSRSNPDLLDRRDQCIQELISRSGGTVMPQADGSLNVYAVGGQALVVGEHAAQLAISAHPYHSDQAQLQLKLPGHDLLLGAPAVGGKLAGLLEFADSVLQPARAELGRLAVGLAQAFNHCHRQGVDQAAERGSDFFNIEPPHLTAHPSNSGNAHFEASYGDLSQLNGKNLQLRFDGKAWSARRVDSGADVPVSGTGTADDPLQLNGVALVISGTAVAGDQFELQPVNAHLNVAITDPAQIAVAQPLHSRAAKENTGKAALMGLEVVNSQHPDLLETVRITFIDSTHYRLNNSAPIAYTPGEPIAANGWEVQLEGNPEAGDVFTLERTSENSADNRQGIALAALENSALFESGRVSLKGALTGLVAQLGSAARVAESGLQAQQAIYTEAVGAREAISGVNLDEEAADMLQLQQAYQAASQMIVSANTLFQSLLQAVSR